MDRHSTIQFRVENISWLTSLFKLRFCQCSWRGSRDGVLKVFGSPEYEHFSCSGDTCKVKTLKKVATGLCYQAHPGRDQSQKVVNGVTEHCYRIVFAVQLSNTMTTSSITSTRSMRWFRCLDASITDTQRGSTWPTLFLWSIDVSNNEFFDLATIARRGECVNVCHD